MITAYPRRRASSKQACISSNKRFFPRTFLAAESRSCAGLCLYWPVSRCAPNHNVDIQHGAYTLQQTLHRSYHQFSNPEQVNVLKHESPGQLVEHDGYGGDARRRSRITSNRVCHEIPIDFIVSMQMIKGCLIMKVGLGFVDRTASQSTIENWNHQCR